jgi:hypothetical protein
MSSSSCSSQRGRRFKSIKEAQARVRIWLIFVMFAWTRNLTKQNHHQAKMEELLLEEMELQMQNRGKVPPPRKPKKVLWGRACFPYH